ncbi:hypothetical protein DSUL_20297 [Desulfovibrionales bacterium]
MPLWLLDIFLFWDYTLHIRVNDISTTVSNCTSFFLAPATASALAAIPYFTCDPIAHVD